MKNARPYILNEVSYKSVKEENYSVALLPWGATEAHNYHLPYGTDNYLSEGAAMEAAKIAWDAGAKPIVLPTVSYGVNTGQMDVPLCLNMNPTTQLAVLRDIVEVLQTHKICKLVIVNGHGGNHFKQIIRELSLEFPEVFICSLNWWQAESASMYFDEPGDHAGELETSTMLHIHPELVLPLLIAGEGHAKKFKIKGLQEGWVSAQRDWMQVTQDTGVGNPAKSTPRKGSDFFEATTQKIANFIVELEKTDLKDMYQ